MIRVDIPMPNITGRTEAERMAQMERYLVLLADRLRLFMGSVDDTQRGGDTIGKR